MSAEKVISFATRSPGHGLSLCAKEDADANLSSQAPEAAERVRNPRYRGLHVVAPGTLASSLPSNSQAQARRIVAQVEWEVEQQATRARATNVRPSFKHESSTMAFEPARQIESPVSVAQRLFSALWSGTHPA